VGQDASAAVAWLREAGARTVFGQHRADVDDAWRQMLDFVDHYAA